MYHLGLNRTLSFLVIYTLTSFTWLHPCRAQDSSPNHSKGQVVNNELFSYAVPVRSFQITDALPFIADTSFILKEKSEAEVFFFADSKKGTLTRFFQFQFESMKPHIEGTYSYDREDSLNLGGLNFYKRIWCFNLVEAAEERPNSDISVVQNMLNNNGVNTTGNYVGLIYAYLSEDKRSELLIIYGEKTDYRNVDCGNEETSLPLLELMSQQVLSELKVEK